MTPEETAAFVYGAGCDEYGHTYEEPVTMTPYAKRMFIMAVLAIVLFFAPFLVTAAL